MKKIVKILAVVFVVLFAVVLIVPAALSGKIGEIVKREANAMLNAKVDFESLDISLLRHFPKASLELNDFSVVGLGIFENQTLVSAERVEVAVNLFSIFSESFEVSKVWLLSPQINGIVAKDGSVNWDILATDSEPDSEQVEAQDNSSFRLSLNSVSVENAKIYYTDNQSSMHFHTEPASLYLSGDLSASTTTLTLEATAGDITFVSGSDSFASNLTATLEGAVMADFDKNRYTLCGLTLAVNSVKAALDGWVELETDGCLTDITIDCSGNDFKNILSLVPAFYTKDFQSLTASGAVSLTGTVKGRMSGENYPSFGLELSVADGRFKYADLPKAVTDINVVASVTNSGGTLDNTKLNLSQFGATFAGNSFSATLKASTPLSNLAFAATAKGRVDLSAVKDVYPLEGIDMAGVVTADMSAAGTMNDIDKGAYDRLAVSGKLGLEGMSVNYEQLPTINVNNALMTLSAAKVALQNLDVKIGKSDISASGSLSNYWGYLLHDKTLSGTLTLNSKLMDLNELMASMNSSEPVEEGKTETTDNVEPQTEPMSVIEVPKNLNLALNCHFDKVLFEKMVIDNFVGAASVCDGVLSLDNLGMSMFDGKAKASASYSTVNAQNPRLRLDAHFDKASFKTTAAQVEMIDKMVPIFEKIEGNYTMSLNCDMTLDSTMSPVLKSVNGGGKITSGNFKLSNIEALNILAKVVGHGTDLQTIESSEATVISFMIKDGDIVTKPFDIKLGKTKLTMSGLTGLDQTIDYKVAVALPQITLHAKIGGTFSSPKVSLDTAKSVESVLESVGVQSPVVTQSVDNVKQQAIAEAEKQAAKLIEKAKEEAAKLVEKAQNPIAKIAAKAAADKLIAEAERKAAQIVEQAKK